MILFPNAKINLGLRILRRRPDGYHDIQTVMMPVGWCDVLEMVPSAAGRTTLTITGRHVDCPTDKNLVMKAFQAVANEIGGLPPTDIYLKKIIPDGAGLGGGSADAAFTVKGLNSLYNIGLDDERMARIAARIGADCPFFIYNRTAYCTGTGTDIDRFVDLDLSRYKLLIAKPRVAAVSTAQAYAGVTPCEDVLPPVDILQLPMADWPGHLVNDFEPSIFSCLPEVRRVKATMQQCGAEYASMSGSGASVYGFFSNDKMAETAAASLDDCDTYLQS